jgi:hypothetical protein
MRRLIAVVIIGIGIAIALYHLVKKENSSVQHDTDILIPGNCARRFDYSGMLFPFPALLITVLPGIVCPKD